MIQVDDRVGSRELQPLFHKYGVDAEICGHLNADFQFCGNGPDGAVMCGFERKELHDFLESMRLGRISGHQADPMIDTYDRRYIVVEGIWRRGRDTGLVETKQYVRSSGKFEWSPVRGNFRVSEMQRFMASLRELGEFTIWRTTDQEDTASYIAEEYHWFDKPFHEHNTHRRIHMPEYRRRNNGHKPVLWRKEVPLVEEWIARLPGIDSRAETIAQNFVSARDMANAEPERWAAIKGIGKKTVDAVVSAITKER